MSVSSTASFRKIGFSSKRDPFQASLFDTPVMSRLPNNTERICIIGKTGSGKTHAAVYQLSMRDIDKRPWIVYDFKFDPLLNSIDGATHIDIRDPIPTSPGLYLVHPEPDDTGPVEDHMREIWRKEHTGVYVDEGYMIGRWNKAYRSLLTQGRSKEIPMITLTQRPVEVDRFTFSESEFFQVFALTHTRDIKKVEEYVPFDLTKRLPKYHSYYYDVNDDRIFELGPAPDADAILDTFDLKLGKLKKTL